MRIYFLIFFIPFILNAQSIKKNILNASSLSFRNNIYIFGLESDKNGLNFKLYKSDLNLSKLDSVKCLLEKENPEVYLDITADTLHGYLNFYLQKANNKNLATLIRYNDSLRLITKTGPFESNKINSLTTFENEIYIFKNSTYTIRTAEDSLGRQFYLNKYTVADEKKVFEYKQAWQLPLEKRNINTTHVFYANDEFVFVYVNIISGEKKGQWVLKIDAKKGQVLKGVKLNNKGDLRWYIYNSFHYDAKQKQLLIAGNIYSDDQIDMENEKFTFKNLDKQNTYFFTLMDSLGENIQRFEKTLPFIYAINKIPSKEINYYHVKIKKLDKTSSNEYVAYCNMYKSINGQLQFIYETGFFYTSNISEEAIEMNTDKIHLPLNTLKGLTSADPKDLNGKIELSNLNEFDKFLYKCPVSDIENNFDKDDLKNPKWILSSSDFNTGKKTFYDIRIGLKGAEKKTLLESSKYNHPMIYKATEDKIILFNGDKESGTVNLQIKTW